MKKLILSLSALTIIGIAPQFAMAGHDCDCAKNKSIVVHKDHAHKHGKDCGHTSSTVDGHEVFVDGDHKHHAHADHYHEAH